MARDSATGYHQLAGAGFDANNVAVDIGAMLGRWERAGDGRLWKVIISPEFGERLDLLKLTRELMQEMGRQLKCELEWTAVAHYNTEHPHVHVALRGSDLSGNPILLKREFIKTGIRATAEDLCTRQIGHRTERDAAESAAREVRGQRYTSLDREIQQMKQPSAGDEHTFPVVIPAGVSAVPRAPYIAERLMFLDQAGLATKLNASTWAVRSDFGAVLRAMQQAHDRQRTIAAHGALISDPRLPLATLDMKNMRSVEGRVLVHGEEENGRDAGRGYFLLEGTDARVYYVPYFPEIESARREGKLKTNSFVRLRKLFAAGKSALAVEDFGAAETILKNKQHLRQAAAEFVARRLVPADDGWGGWLGRYQSAVKQTVDETLDRGITRPAPEWSGR